MDPRIGFALPHAEQAALHHLKGVSLQGGEEEEQPIFRCRQGTMLVHAEAASRPRSAIEAPRRHMRLERRLKGRVLLLKLVKGQACQIQEFRGAGLHISAPYTGHT